MKRFKRLVITVITCLFAVSFAACNGMSTGDPPNAPFAGGATPITIVTSDQDSFQQLQEHPFTDATKNDSSAFRLDATAAAYPIVRTQAANGSVNRNAVRIEELLNYFDYDYAVPSAMDTVAFSNAIAPCPWNDANYVLRVGLRTKDVLYADIGRSNLVLLVDVSTSMDGYDRIGLVRESLLTLVSQLHPDDLVTLITYAGDATTVLDGVSAQNAAQIAAAVGTLKVGGKTGGEHAIHAAYAAAQKHFIEGGNNRIVLLTDGDFNLGASSIDDLKALISDKRDTGVMLSVFGYGYGNLKDDVLETLALNGNGSYDYIDSLAHARRVMTAQIGGAMETVAYDAKAMVEFDPDAVAQYRLLGYENKTISIEDFTNPKTDAGELGAGAQVTALYELVPTVDFATAKRVATASISYRDTANVDRTVQDVLRPSDFSELPDDDFAFQLCVAEFGLVLRRSKYAPDANISDVRARLSAMTTDAPFLDPYRLDFVRLASTVRQSN